MILPDVNLLLYAYDSASPNHSRAASWWEDCLNRSEPVGIARVVAFGFVRLATSARVFAEPFTLAEADDRVRSWYARSHVVDVSGGPDHISATLALLRQVESGGNLVTDAQIAALAIELGAVVHTNDADFQRFPGLKTYNPVAA